MKYSHILKKEILNKKTVKVAFGSFFFIWKWLHFSIRNTMLLCQNKMLWRESRRNSSSIDTKPLQEPNLPFSHGTHKFPWSWRSVHFIRCWSFQWKILAWFEQTIQKPLLSFYLDLTWHILVIHDSWALGHCLSTLKST